MIQNPASELAHFSMENPAQFRVEINSRDLEKDHNPAMDTETGLNQTRN